MDLRVKFGDEEYDLSKRLRVAYKIQGANAHKNYQEVFEEMGDLPLDKQVEMLYYSFKDANPNSQMSKTDFLDNFLDNYGLAQLMELLTALIEGITYTGMTPEEIDDLKKRQAQRRQEMEAMRSNT